MTIQNTTRESVKRCAWCGRICFNESEPFCSNECKAEAILGDHELVRVSDNVARTETGAPVGLARIPAPATASHGTRGTCVASVPSSTPARRPDGAVASCTESTGADLSRLVSPS